MDSLRLASLSFAGVALSLFLGPSAHAQEDDAPTPRYTEAMTRELDALDIPHTCEPETASRARCVFTFEGQASQRTFSVHLVYSDDTDTIYVYVARYALALPDAESTPAALRRMMEINWELLGGKLEWDGMSGEVRLAIILNTDSNFDRRAFRSVVRTIGPLADRYAGELGRLTAGE